MPIYEFRCSGCGHVQEFIITGSGENVEMKCGECNGEALERVLSRTNYAMGSSGSGSRSGPSATTRNCGPGKSCTSIELPGYSKS